MTTNTALSKFCTRSRKKYFKVPLGIGWGMENSVHNLVSREIGRTHKIHYQNVLKRLDITWPNGSDTYDAALWESPIFACVFSSVPQYENLLACANEDGYVSLWKMSSSSPKFLCTTVTHNNAVFDVSWHPKETKLVTVSGDNSAILWDTRDSSLMKVTEFLGHDQTVKTAAFNLEATDIFGTGDRKGVVHIWDIRTGKSENRINPAHERLVPGYLSKPFYSKSSITGLGFFGNQLLSVSAGSSIIKLWDLRKYYSVRVQKPQPVMEFSAHGMDKSLGFSHLSFDHKNQRMYVSCINSSIYSYHLSALGPKPVARYIGLSNNSYYVKTCVSPDGNYLLSGSVSEYAYIWSTQRAAHSGQLPIRALETYSKEVNCVSWSANSKDQFLIVTCCENEPFCVWGIPDKECAEVDEMTCFSDNESYVAQNCAHEGGNELIRNEIRKWNFVTNTNELCQLKLNHSFCDDFSKDMRPQNKRTLREMLENCSPDSENRAYKARRMLSPKRLFLSLGMENEVIEFGHSAETYGSESSICSLLDSANLSDSCSDMCNLESVFADKDDKNIEENVSIKVHNKTEPFSPTSNLPNYVVDGTSPTHVCRPRRRECTDWLTKLRHEKTGSSGASPHTKSNGESPIRKQTEKNHQKQSGNILKFFRVLGKSNDERSKSLQPNLNESRKKPI